MERRKFTREFKLEAVRLIKGRGVPYAQASQDLGVHPSQLRDWVKKFAEDADQAFPGHGQMKPEQLEIARLKREVAKLKAERDILKNARRSLSSCGHRNGLRYVLSAPRGAAVGFCWHQPRKKTWSMGCCGLESGDAVERSRLVN
jgi:transposase